MKKIIEILKWDLITYKRTYMLQWLGVFGIALGIMIVPIISLGSSCGEVNFAATNNTFIAMLNIIASSVYLTLLSAPFDGKQQRISYLMLPASLRQKLIARLIIVMVIVPLALTVSTMVADLIQMVVYFVLSNGVMPHSYTGIYIEGLQSLSIFSGIEDFGDLVGFLYILSSVLFFICFGFMCGALWTKRAFLKSIGLGVAFSFAASFAFMLFALTGLSLNMIIDPAKCINVSSVGMYETLSILLLILAYAIDFALLRKGYKAFVGRQLVKH